MIQLTNCKVQMKMRVHRPLQQPIVSAGKSRLFAGKDRPENGSAELSACRPHSDSHSPPVAPLRRFSARSKRTAGSVCGPLLLPHLRWLTGWLRTGVLKEEEEEELGGGVKRWDWVVLSGSCMAYEKVCTYCFNQFTVMVTEYCINAVQG